MSISIDEDDVRSAVRRQFEDVYSVLGDLSRVKKPVNGFSTSTGVVSLDAALGGRLPSGAVEIYGEAATGKTTLLYEIITTAQKSGFRVALCPSEYLDIPYMKRFGVNLRELILITGNHGEDTLEEAARFIEVHQDIPSLLAFDSATSLRPEKDMPGDWALMFDVFLETILESTLHPSTCIVMVNQVRMKRSVDPRKFFVDGVVTSTARKIVDRFSARLEVSRGENRGGDREMRVDIVSNVLSKPATVVSLPMDQGHGIDTMKDLLWFGMSVGIVTQASSWYVVGDNKLGPGLKEAVRQLEKNPEIVKYILDHVMVKA